MEINIQIKNVQKPEDAITAFAAIGQGQALGQGQAAASSSRNRPPIQRARREAVATTAATRRSPSLILSQRELEALQKVHHRGGKDAHSTDTADETDRTVASGVRPKMKPQPFSALARHHQGRTLSPRPYYQRGDQVKNYAIKNYEHDNLATQRMQKLEEEAAKYKQRLRSAGIQVTPKKKELPIQDGSPEAASSSNQGPQGGVPALQPLQPSQDPPQKRRRLQRGDAKKSYQQMIEEPFNVIKKSGQDPPVSMTSLKTWTTNIKQNLPADKQTARDNHMQQVQNILEEGKFTKAQPQEMATRWGLPISLITTSAATPKTLQQLVSAVTFLAV
eukprot:s4670_g7.t1